MVNKSLIDGPWQYLKIPIWDKTERICESVVNHLKKKKKKREKKIWFLKAVYIFSNFALKSLHPLPI